MKPRRHPEAQVIACRWAASAGWPVPHLARVVSAVIRDPALLVAVPTFAMNGRYHRL